MLTKEDKQWIRDEIGSCTKDIREDVAVLKDEVAVLKRDVAELKSEVAVLKSEVGVLKRDVAELKSDVATLKRTVESLNENVIRTNTYLENVMAPLVKELGICYTSATKDYSERAAEIDGMKIELSACSSLTQENSVKIHCMEVADGARAVNA